MCNSLWGTAFNHGLSSEHPVNDAYYDRFNTRCDVADAIGLNLGDHLILHEWVTQEDHPGDDFEYLTDVQQLAVRKKSKDNYLAYMMVQQSNSSSAKLRSILSDAYALGDDKYLANRQAAFHFLEKLSKDVVRQPTVTHEVSSFSQKGNQHKQKSNDKAYRNDWYDKKKCKNITCYNYGEKRYPAPHCPKGEKKPAAKSSKSKKKDDDDNSRSRKSSKNSAVMAKMKKDLKSQSRTFATFKSMLQDMEEEESDLSDLDESGVSFFQWHDLGSNIQHVLHNSSTPKYRVLDLTKVILLDSQSTMGLFCNQELISEIIPSAQSLTVRGNGGTLEVYQKATILGYEKDV